MDNVHLQASIRSVGGFYALALDAVVAMFTRPLAWRSSSPCRPGLWRGGFVPTLLLAIPFTVLVVFT